MKMTLKQVADRHALLLTLGGLTLPAKLGFAISKNDDALTHEVNRTEQARLSMCKRYADKDEDGDPMMADSVVHGERIREYVMSAENQKAFTDEYAELLTTEVDVPVQTVPQDIIERLDADARYSALTVGQIAGLSFMLEVVSDD